MDKSASLDRRSRDICYCRNSIVKIMKMVLASALVTFERVQPQQKKHPAMGRKRAYSEERGKEEKVPELT
ncbi:hypothetical protein MM59RIKEN_15660 [Pusillibacter faecalis]|uniref:Uncharacterized protein n=1 Tax=Pusillibacter faecalis TaxID=2714358 RepID=A0A810QDB3_9FIRM|nr:hypothetical protein [Pusillibacter faecalis]BCK84247.1 hypothetical protein MM59RIKEN_15660 [Pusillibacter faecalis]